MRARRRAYGGALEQLTVLMFGGTRQPPAAMESGGMAEVV